MNDPVSPAEVLLKAADRVQFVGWTQNSLSRDVDGEDTLHPWDPEAVSWCATGAIMAEMETYCVSEILCAVADRFGPRGRCLDLVDFNNAPDRTAGEVADFLRRAAKELSNGAAA